MSPMPASLISGIQQIGIGVRNAPESFTWYRRAFGLDIPVFDDPGEPVLMTRYTGGEVQARHAILAASIRGGGGFEIWQYTSREPQPPKAEPQLGDLGILCPKVKSTDVGSTYDELAEMGADLLAEPVAGPDGRVTFFVRDPWSNVFQVVPSDSWFVPGGRTTGGVSGCVVGVSDVDRALELYGGILGYDSVLYDEKGSFDDVAVLPGGTRRFRRVLLTHSEPRKGPFSQWLGTTAIELVELSRGRRQRVFSDRYWGDLGFIHLCFDVRGMDDLKARCATAGFPFTVDSSSSFDMGQAAGRFAYLEDPDGTLIELVETHRVPIIKKIGWFLDLSRRGDKPLPRWMIKTWGMSRVRD